jgi:hypothetical protein
MRRIPCSMRLGMLIRDSPPTRRTPAGGQFGVSREGVEDGVLHLGQGSASPLRAGAADQDLAGPPGSISSRIGMSLSSRWNTSPSLPGLVGLDADDRPSWKKYFSCPRRHEPARAPVDGCLELGAIYFMMPRVPLYLKAGRFQRGCAFESRPLMLRFGHEGRLTQIAPVSGRRPQPRPPQGVIRAARRESGPRRLPGMRKPATYRFSSKRSADQESSPVRRAALAARRPGGGICQRTPASSTTRPSSRRPSHHRRCSCRRAGCSRKSAAGGFHAVRSLREAGLMISGFPQLGPAT